jgi:hypothetical protein
VADGEDAAMDTMQVPSRHPPRNPILVEAAGEQLIKGEHAV